METIGEKVAYLKGLCEGLKIDDDKAEGKVIKGILDVLEDISLAIEDVEDEVFELSELVDEIDEDLGAVEEDFYGDDEYGCCDCDCCDDEDFDDEGDFYEITCPKCGDKIYLEDSEIFDDGVVVCPECNEEIDFDLNDLDEE